MGIHALLEGPGEVVTAEKRKGGWSPVVYRWVLKGRKAEWVKACEGSPLLREDLGALFWFGPSSNRRIVMWADTDSPDERYREMVLMEIGDHCVELWRDSIRLPILERSLGLVPKMTASQKDVDGGVLTLWDQLHFITLVGAKGREYILPLRIRERQIVVGQGGAKVRTATRTLLSRRNLAISGRRVEAQGSEEEEGEGANGSIRAETGSYQELPKLSDGDMTSFIPFFSDRPVHLRFKNDRGFQIVKFVHGCEGADVVPWILRYGETAYSTEKRHIPKEGLVLAAGRSQKSSQRGGWSDLIALRGEYTELEMELETMRGDGCLREIVLFGTDDILPTKSKPFGNGKSP